MSLLLSTGALLLGAAGAPANGGEQWLTLDSQLQQLAAQDKPAEKKGLETSAYVKFHYFDSSDISVAPSGNDLGGFGFQALRMNFQGKVGDYLGRVTLEGTKNGQLDDVNVKDAWVRFPVTGQVNAQVGNFKGPFVYSGLAGDERLVMYERSLLGGIFAGRDAGLMFDGKVQQLLWQVSAQNGGDGAGDELLLIGRLRFAALGDVLNGQEGGFGPDQPTRVTLGLSYLDDGSADDATAVAAEAQAVVQNFWLQAEMVDLDQGFTAVTSGFAGKAGPLADGTPFGVTAEYLANAHWGFALRYDDTDNSDDTNAITAGVNYYVDGHAAKWQLNYVAQDSDNAAAEIDRLILGLTIIL
jgi:hypothetical protein